MLRDYSRIPLGALMAAALLMVCGGLLYCYHIKKTDCVREEPARMAVYARDMMTQDAWLAPMRNGAPRVDAPPLYLWAIKLTALFTGKITPFESRLPGSISAILMIFLAAWWFYMHASRYERPDNVDTPLEGFSLLAGLMTAACPVLFGLGRMGVPAPMFALLYLAAAFCWAESLEARRSFYAGRSWRFWILWGYALAGVAMLAGGPIVLLLLWAPYALSARSYHLGRPTGVHVIGLTLALLIGGWWPLWMAQKYPAIAADLIAAWLPFQIDGAGAFHQSFMEYGRYIVLGNLPWIILAAVMMLRVVGKLDRSPTLVFWTWSVAGNLLWLWLLGFRTGDYLPAVIPLVSLLATASLHRWYFENVWAGLWRMLLRIALLASLALGMFIAILLHSGLGMILFVLIALSWLGWMIRSRTQEMEYSPWETTVRLAAMTALVFLAGEAMLLSNWEPWRGYHQPVIGYFARLRQYLHADLPRQLYLDDGRLDSLYRYYLPDPLIVKQNLKAIKAQAGRQTYLLANHDIDRLMNDSQWIPVTACPGADPDRPIKALFKAVSSEEQATSPPLTRLERLEPLRMAALGNTGKRTRQQLEVARQLDKICGKQYFGDILLLGNNIYGPNFFNELDFINSFVQPYLSLLKRGVTFHALLGHEDQSSAWVQMRYGPFNMYGRRYYAVTLGEGLADCFMLDSERLRIDDAWDETQLEWLEHALETSRAPWKIVGLNRALLSAAANGRPDDKMAERLIPLLDKHRVAVVLSSGGNWYERLALNGHPTVFINAGWSANTRSARFREDSRLKLGYDQRPGFVLFDISAQQLQFTAMNDRRVNIDQGKIQAAATLDASGRPVP